MRSQNLKVNSDRINDEGKKRNRPHRPRYRRSRRLRQWTRGQPSKTPYGKRRIFERSETMAESQDQKSRMRNRPKKGRRGAREGTRAQEISMWTPTHHNHSATRGTRETPSPGAARHGMLGPAGQQRNSAEIADSYAQTRVSNSYRKLYGATGGGSGNILHETSTPPTLKTLLEGNF